MAVIQISKIQVRRGQKNSASGVPQLSSAEFAWAVDTQELFIGNGSVAEGAPYVGNTKVLTEHDNILELASSYTFASDDFGITAAVPRSLQSKLDEYVSVVDFGAIGDGSTDCSDAFEAAFTQLFRNTDDTYKKVLLVPNGDYLFLRDLEIPSNAILEGETRSGSVLIFSSNNIRLTTENGTELALFDTTDRPENIKISNLTISRTTGQTDLSGGRNIELNAVTFLGDYNLGDVVSNIATEPPAVFWEITKDAIKVTDLIFRDCLFQSNSIGIRCSQSVKTDTYIQFRECKFFEVDTGIYIGGVSQQGNFWDITDCYFEEVAKQTFYSSHGGGTKINDCRFVNCGNNTNLADSPVTAIIRFGESANNVVVNCSSDRQQKAGIQSSNIIPAITEVYNADIVNFTDRVTTDIFLSNSPSPLAVFSAENKHYYIDYVLRLSSYTRAGRLTFAIDSDFGDISFTDNYQYSSTSSTQTGGVVMTGFEFSVELKDNTTTFFGDSALSPETIVLYYKNPLVGGSTGTISFDVTYGV